MWMQEEEEKSKWMDGWTKSDVDDRHLALVQSLSLS
jgi:hypothetical protein